MRIQFGLVGKLVLAFIALSGLLQGINHFTASDYRKAALQRQEYEKVISIARLVEPRIHREEEWLRSSSYALQRELASRMSSKELPESDSLAQWLNHVSEHNRLDELEVTDEHGTILHRAHAPTQKGDRSTRWGVDEALSGVPTMFCAPISEGALILYTEPVQFDGRILGTITSGRRIGNEFIETLKNEYGADLALISRRGVPISSNRATLPSPDMTAVEETFQQKIPVYRSNANSRTTQVYFPIQIIDEAWVLMAEIDSSAALANYDDNNHKALLITFFMMSLAILVTLGIVYLTLKPLRALRTRAEHLFTELAGPHAQQDRHDDIESLVRILNDFTDLLMQRNQELSAQRADLRISAKAFDSQQPMLITHATGEILKANKAFTQMSGYGLEELSGRVAHILNPERHSETFNRELRESLRNSGQWEGEIIGKRKTGEEYPQKVTISSVREETGGFSHLIIFYSDISEHKNTARKIRELSHFDTLTRLPNRSLLIERLKQASTSARRHQSYGSLVMIDLDHFKSLNETQGHHQGDLLIQQAGQRLLATVRSSDTVARLGGDEFAIVILLDGLATSHDDAANRTEIVCNKILAKFNEPYQLGDMEYRCTTSVGATLFGTQEISIETLMIQADIALHQAKADGRNTLCFFDPSMQEMVHERVALERSLQYALNEQQFLLHYQPQVTNTGHIIGAEALIRWKHPERGMVSPASFIPLAEETGEIIPIGLWVLQTACEQLQRWSSDPRFSHLTIAINVCAKQFLHHDFVSQVLAALEASGANPHRLKLELTETMLVERVEELIVKMETLQTRGINFALDDFGTGYSSLTYLKRLPLEQLKIDQSFVRDVMSDANDAAIAKTIVALAQSLGLNVIAEGVENEAQRGFLAKIGCTTYQGYFYSRPLAVTDFETFVRQHDTGVQQDA